jgi:hypothetical protein
MTPDQVKPPLQPTEVAGTFDVLNPDWNRVSEAQAKVLEVIQEKGLEVSEVCFAGYNPQTEKLVTDEFSESDGRHQFFFGTAGAMNPPSPTDDEELAGDKWVVNPLHYAMQPGQVLGVYDLALLTPFFLEYDQAFGTYLVSATQAQVDVAQLDAITIY